MLEGQRLDSDMSVGPTELVLGEQGVQAGKHWHGCPSSVPVVPLPAVLPTYVQATGKGSEELLAASESLHTGVVVWVWHVPNRRMCLSIWSPDGGAVWEGGGSFRRWGLAGGRK